MKLKFGKKTLALLLMLTVALSLCTVSAWAGEAKTLAIGEKATLSVESAGTRTLTWTSSNPGVAAVSSNGVVMGKTVGSATITATAPAVEANAESGAAAAEAINETWSITVNEGTISGISVSPTTISVPFGTSESGALAKLASDVTVTATNSNYSTFPVKGTWSFAAGSWTGAVSDTGVTATVTYGTGAAAKTATITVTVAKNRVQSISFTPSSVKVPKGAAWSTVKKQLPLKASVQLETGKVEWTINGDILTDWTEVSTASVGSVNTSVSLKSEATGYDLNGKNAYVAVQVVDKYTLGDISHTAFVDSYRDDVGNFVEDIRKAIENATGLTINSSSITFNWGAGAYVEVSGSSFYVKENKIDDLEEAGTLSDTVPYTAVYGGVTYSGNIKLALYSENVTIDFGKASGTLAKAASALNERLKAYCGGSLAYVEIEDIDLDGGELFTDSTCTASVDTDETYTDSTFSQMYYVPDGSGETTVIEFTARTSSSTSSNRLSGYLFLTSDKYVRLSYQITTDDTLPFSAEEFESAFLDLDDDYATLEYITFTGGIPNSKTAGYLYYDGDTKVSTSKKYYVESSKSSELAIDDLTFVPGTKGGVYSIQFSMRGEKDNGKSVTETGVIQITVVEKADVTISTAKNASVTVDFDQFQDFFDANVSKSKKDYIITHIVFEDAPHSSSAGYLYAGSKKLTSPDGKEFTLDSDYKGDYDFDDLTYMGGSKDSATRATFSIYGKKTANAKSTTKLVEGTVDFVTGNAGSTTKDLNASMKASQVMAFSNEINTLLGIQSDMQSLTFTSLPRTGKLVYDWGASGQTDVTVNTEYYLTASGTKPLLRNVTFVPGYSTNKSSNTVTFGYKAVNAKGKTVTGTFTITVSHAYVSERFYDVSNYLYADSVDFLYNEKITTGTGATTFNPNGQVTRMEFVTFLYRAAGSPSVTGLTNRFTDVSATTHSYYYNAILWATQNGITTGTSATTFNPTGLVTHSELLTFLYRYDVNYLRHSSSKGSLSAYSGWSSVASWAQTGAKWAAYKGILTDSTTPPAANGTRATVALWMHRMLTL